MRAGRFIARSTGYESCSTKSFPVERSGSYRILTNDCDADRIEQLFDVVAAMAASDALRVLDEAVTYGQGQPFGEFAAETFAMAEANRLSLLIEAAQTRRLQLMVDARRFDEVISETARLTVEHPFNESIWALRLRAFAHAGRQVEAGREFQRFRDNLAEETGLQPSDELVALDRRILSGEIGPLAEPPPQPTASAFRCRQHHWADSSDATTKSPKSQRPIEKADW